MLPAIAFWDAMVTAACYMSIIGLGQYVSGSAGVFSVAHAAFAGIGGYAAAVLAVRFGTPLPVSLLAAALVASLPGFLLGYLSWRSDKLVAGLATIAFAEGVVVMLLNTPALGGAQGVLGVPLETNLPLAAGMLAIVALLVWRFDSSRLALAARACRDDFRTARSIGINIMWVKTLTFGLGAGIAGLGGGLGAYYLGVQSPAQLGFFYGSNYLLYVAFGGSYSVWGALFGSLTLTLLPEALRISDTVRFVLFGLLLAFSVAALPGGVIVRRPLGYLGPLQRPGGFLHRPHLRRRAPAGDSHVNERWIWGRKKGRRQATAKLD